MSTDQLQVDIDTTPLRLIDIELGPLLLTWIDFNPSMDKYPQAR